MKVIYSYNARKPKKTLKQGQISLVMRGLKDNQFTTRSYFLASIGKKEEKKN